jgi:sugar phosphate isomerase/epimerase
MPDPIRYAFERRQFLTTLIGSGLAMAAAGQEKKLRPEGDNIRFGLVTYMWAADWDIAAILANCNKAGIKGVELRVDHAHGVNPTLSTERCHEIKAQFGDAGIELIGMGTNFEFHSTDREELRRNIVGAKEYIRLSHDIGGSGVKVKPNKLPQEVKTEQTLDQIGKSLAELGDYSLGFGQEIRLEVHGGVSDLGHIQQVMQIAKSDNVRVCWNSNDKDNEDEGIEANFAKVRDHLGHTLHLRELDGAGAYPYAKLAKLLVEADFDGWTCLEGHHPPKDPAARIAGLIKQREIWEKLVTDARQA